MTGKKPCLLVHVLQKLLARQMEELPTIRGVMDIVIPGEIVFTIGCVIKARYVRGSDLG